MSCLKLNESYDLNSDPYLLVLEDDDDDDAHSYV